MRSVEEFRRALALRPSSPLERGRIVSICLRKGGGVHEQVASVELDRERGLIGDRWELHASRKKHSQVTLMNAAVGEVLSHPELAGWEAGDNFQVDLDISEANLPPGTQLRMGTATLEVTSHPHRGCSKFSARFGPDALAWVNLPENLRQRLRGVHAAVIQSGRVSSGEEIIVVRDPQLSLIME